LFSAVMSQRPTQKLKCLFEKYFLTIIKSMLENKGYIYAPINPDNAREGLNTAG